MLERACLEKAIPCISVCRNSAHSTWVTNVLDRAVIASLATNGSGLYGAEFQPEVELLIDSIVDTLGAQDNNANSMPALDEVIGP